MDFTKALLTKDRLRYAQAAVLAAELAKQNSNGSEEQPANSQMGAVVRTSLASRIWRALMEKTRMVKSKTMGGAILQQVPVLARSEHQPTR